MNPYFLLAIGLLLIFLEFYLPGAIMGTVGGVLVLISVVVFAMESSSAGTTILFFMVALASVAIVIYLSLRLIRSTGSKNTLFLKSDQTGYQASSFDASAVGKDGVALTDLKPGGYILLEGQKYQAISVSGYIPKGSHVNVISGQEESLIVKLIKKESS